MTTPLASLKAGDPLPFTHGSKDEIAALLKEYHIGLTVDEAKKIVDLLGRDPTLTEAVIWGIQGSEHCSYKSSKRFLRRFVTEGAHIILGPVEDSGIVAMTDGPPGKRWGLVITHESHNHPSQIVPFEGAATGVGGTVRDVVCMGARVIGCMDLLRLGDLNTDESRTIATEVIRGIGGYGNPLGVPNLGGDTVFDASYNANCLVNAIALGIVREDEIIHSYVPKEAGEVGYDIILVGKPTDRSGFGGAAFASVSMEEEEKEKNTGAVQEPNPFLERHLLASCYALFDYLAEHGKLQSVSCKDLGAGGVVCASVEQVVDQGCGAVIDLDAVHVSVPDLPAEVIACAETQERLCFTCHPDLTEMILTHFNETWDLPSVAQNARASVIGTVTNDGIYTLTHHGSTICQADAEAITCGIQYERKTHLVLQERREPDITCNGNRITVKGYTQAYTIQELFERMLSHPNHASPSPALLHYDKNVIGNTILEPGEADAGVIAPLKDLQSYVHQGHHSSWDTLPNDDAWRGIAVAGDGNGRYGRIHPYYQGVNAALEAMRNVVCVGATPRALTDCLNYGNPEIPEQLAELEQGVQGIADVSSSITFDGEAVPVISGNVSLYNGKPDGSSIDPTAIVSCVGVLPDARAAVSMPLKRNDSTLLFIGERKNECGGSAYYALLEHLLAAERDALLGSAVPMPDLKKAQQEMQLLLETLRSGSVLACHDISDGGLLLALFEMTLPQRKTGGTIGIHVDLAAFESDLRSDTLLFAETGGFILEVLEEDALSIIETAHRKEVAASIIGSTSASPSLSIQRESEDLFHANLQDLHQIWHSGLSSALQS